MEEFVSRELKLRMSNKEERVFGRGPNILRLVKTRLSSVERSQDPEPAAKPPINIAFRTRVKPDSMDQSDWELFSEAINLMQQHIYSASYRIHELDPLVLKYDGSPGFRTAFVVCALEDLLEEMRQICLRLVAGTDRSVKTHLDEYLLILKKQVDITYVVERAARMLEYYAALREQFRQEFQGYQDKNNTLG